MTTSTPDDGPVLHLQIAIRQPRSNNLQEALLNLRLAGDNYQVLCDVVDAITLFALLEDAKRLGKSDEVIAILREEALLAFRGSGASLSELEALESIIRTSN